MIIKKYLEKEKEGKQQCQNCLEFGHWTYECTRPQTYVYRPSRTKLFKQNKFNLFNIKDQKREDSPKTKEEKEKEKQKRNKSKSFSRSNSYSSSGSGKSKSYSSGSSPQSHSSSNSSYSSSSSSFSRSDSDNSKNKDEIIQNKKRKKLNEMLDNLTKNDKEKNKDKKHKNRSRSRSRSRHHRRRERHRRSRSRSDSWRRERRKKAEELMKNNNRNNFYGEYKLKKGERWKKIAEIEQEDSDSPGRGKNGAFRKRPYE